MAGVADLTTPHWVDSASIDKIAVLVSGCRDGADGIAAKQHMVSRFVAEGILDYLDVVLQLHTKKVVVVSPTRLLKTLTYHKPADAAWANSAPTASEATHPGFFLASVLARCEEKSAMPGIVDAYIAQNPQTSPVELIKYINRKGLISYPSDAAVAKAIDWKPPEDDDSAALPPWRLAWGDESIPTGKAWYATLRDERGRRSHLCFLGSITAEDKFLVPPSQVRAAHLSPCGITAVARRLADGLLRAMRRASGRVQAVEGTLASYVHHRGRGQHAPSAVRLPRPHGQPAAVLRVG